ncbi:activating signal cointegrator 1 complex subunit 2 [Chelonus insularis]|uniref:activating signal cointegrator 1 complex subunit 2 n=1 Tax=Chelonus insularis TaxID=460826 RepID=UPI00158A64CB|nr:activating signal cointegrator 1 complex subunit 2 [Chelonus insularis]
MEYFENPENKPLEKVELVIYENEIPKIVPALSKYHVEKRHFMRYSKPRIYHKDGTEIIGAKDMWLEMINYVIQDYEWLLKLPFYKFWSNIVFYYSYIDSLKVVLQESPRFHELKDFPDDEEMKERLYTLHKKVINIFFRIVTNKKNASEFISNEYHGYLIYENFLITVPVMIQLAQLFGRENEKIIHKIIKKAVKYQPRYQDDFKELVRFSCQILGEMEEKLLNNPNTRVHNEEKGVLYISNVDKKSSSSEINCDEIEDMIIYLMDFTSSVEIFITVYPPVVEYFSSDYFLMKIISIYENVLPELYRRLEKLINKNTNKEKYQEMTEYLKITRLEIIKIFRAITFRGIASILRQPDITEAPNVKESVDQFLNYLTSAVSDKHLMIDYNQIYPISDDLELIHQITSDVDQIKVSFLKRLVTELLINYAPKASNNVVNNTHNSLQPVAGPSGVQNSTSTSTTINSTNISEVELKSLIYSIKDVMYELGEGFIQKCLQHYNYNTESVINAILEDTLPPEIKKLDRNLPYISLETETIPMNLTKDMEGLSISNNNQTTEDGKQKLNNEDEIVEVFRGKRKSKYKNLNDMLNDKSFKNKVVETYSKYSLVEGYDDEYDDTYDSLNDNVILLNDNPDIDKPFTIPRVLRTNERIEENDEESENEEEPTTSNASNNRDNFVQDPAVLRARAEQRRLSHQDRGRKKKTGDVVGNPKGQGNDKEVLINRDRKNTNKSSQANHNRRSGAEWKRRQGMVPS